MAGRRPKYRQILEYMREGIVGGRFDPGRRLPSEMELAAKFSASRPTAVRAMHELQALGLIERRVGSGTYVRRPGRDASRRRSIAVIAPGLGHTEILDPIASEIRRASESLGFAVSDPVRGPGDDGEHAGHAEESCDLAIERGVAGVFFSPIELSDDRAALNEHLVGKFDRAGIAVVLLDRDIAEFPARSRYDLVGIDSFAAAVQVTSHMISTGRRRLRFVACPQYPSTTDLRIAGFHTALQGAGIDAGDHSVAIGDPTDRAFVKPLLKRPKTDGVICSNDLTAARLMQTLTALDVRVPDQVAIAGFDDVAYATLLSVPLTTMRQPCRAIGLAAVQAMAERIEHPTLPPRQILLSSELIVRGSTAQR